MNHDEFDIFGWANQRIRELWWQKITIEGDKPFYKKSLLGIDIEGGQDDEWVVKLYRESGAPPFEPECTSWPEWPTYIIRIKNGQIVGVDYLICLNPYGIGVDKWYESWGNPEQDWFFLAIAHVIRKMEWMLKRIQETGVHEKLQLKQELTRAYGVKWYEPSP